MRKPFDLKFYIEAKEKPKVFNSVERELLIRYVNSLATEVAYQYVGNDSVYATDQVRSWTMEVPYEPTDEEIYKLFKPYVPGQHATVASLKGFAPYSWRAISELAKRIHELEEQLKTK